MTTLNSDPHKDKIHSEKYVPQLYLECSGPAGLRLLKYLVKTGIK